MFQVQIIAIIKDINISNQRLLI